MANNGSVSGFKRRRYPIQVPLPSGAFGTKYPSEGRQPSAVFTANKKAAQAARAARAAAVKILGKVGLRWEGQDILSLTGERLSAYMEASALTKPHGFIPGQDTTYKHLHPTKGFRFAPV
jgi:hypothetical protein